VSIVSNRYSVGSHYKLCKEGGRTFIQKEVFVVHDSEGPSPISAELPQEEAERVCSLLNEANAALIAANAAAKGDAHALAD
jgi:hypothetical protein